MSGFKVDDFLNKIQHRITTYESTIEWIPFDRLENIKEIGKGGFSIVYSTTWIDGRTIEYSTDSFVKKKRIPNCTVALKILNNAENLNDFLHELIVQNPPLSRFTHQDFHSGNMLLKNSTKEVFGILPYIAPEVLCKKAYSKSSDISSLGTPQCYVNEANQCIVIDPLKRPLTDDLRSTFAYWYNIYLKKVENLTTEVLKIKNEFEGAEKIEKIVSTLSKNQSSYRS
ncbi:hypothetical protein Glove_326g195 [Diversispora epigaea]|uniref:Protein kinase domain-containing protein n=1 Tax=Diversispora epigaea TaxID=1348612 RepID=A0A397HUA7_9GLOM|nr:hypothetical protein Glove_326g195 [Diversispora epigaea]